MKGKTVEVKVKTEEGHTWCQGHEINEWITVVKRDVGVYTSHCGVCGTLLGEHVFTERAGKDLVITEPHTLSEVRTQVEHKLKTEAKRDVLRKHLYTCLPW